MQRRAFLKQSGLVSGSMLLPAIFHLSCSKPDIVHHGRKLVMVHLNGGNDSLNTLIPYKDENYFIKRPSIAVAPDDLLRIDDRYGFNPAMKSLMEVYRSGHMLILNGVGFEAQEASHYQAARIWQTAFTEPADQGNWIDRFHHFREGKSSAVVNGITVEPDAEDMVLCNEEDFRLCLDQILSSIGKHMDTGIFHLSLDGFDTHHMQRAKHDRLLTCLSDDLRYFLDGLESMGQKDNVLVMIYSEFGRAVAENTRRGTDHGTGGSVFVLGNTLKQKGVFNAPSSLSNAMLDIEVDFRDIYATILNNWFQTDAKEILGGTYQVMDWV